MADLDKDGIPDNIDIDRGSGTNKAPSTTPLADAQSIPSDVKTIIDAVLGAGGSGATGGPKSGTSTTTTRVKLTTNTAREYMQAAAEANGFTGKFTSADVTAFMDAFSKEEARQIEKIIISTSQKGSANVTENSVRTEFASLFKPQEFASDWVWGKISFEDDKNLAAKNLSTLSDVRGIVKKFQLLGVTDNEVRDVAKLIAMGKKTIDDYTVELQGKAALEYPLLADRFKTNPKLTTYDIASPVIKMLAKTWEVDEDTIGLDNPLIMSYLRPGGADGKGVVPSYYDILLKAKADPKYQTTQQANNEARDGATSLAQSLGFGLGA